ncbi:nucleolar protein 12-like [Physella acuta]|uniref:nucleolar protein 12-like n=1 Tax=Physella acuta TaxID=109671 RepID=UPI0027DAB5BC|nr:nucleolar protein 12-like [Physella acuta]
MAAPTKHSKNRRPKNRQTKIFLEFDEKARSEYLRGFQKRKNERKKQAREKNDQRILEERKQLLKQARDLKTNHLREKSVVIPEIEHLVDPVVYDLPEHTVTISHIGDVDFVGKSGLRLGQNTAVPKVAEDASSHSEDEEAQAKPKENKSLRHKLAACSNQLSSAKLKAKKMKKKHMLKQKFQAKKKGEKKGKKKKSK